MAKKLTALAVENLKPGAARREVPDGTSGLRLIIQPSGAKSWATRFRIAGKPKKLTLGTVDALTLAEARVQAAAALALVKKGIDPIATTRAEKAAAKKAAVEKSGNTIERLSALFLEEHYAKRRPATSSQVKSIFAREVLPRWRGRLVADVTRSDVRELLRDIAKDRPILANRCQAYLSRFFRWLVSQDYLASLPIVAIDRQPEAPRDRALNDDEIRAFWTAADQLPAPIGDVFKLLLLSGCRRQEVVGIEWRELDIANKIWTLPAARSKSKVSHASPLGPLAWSLIEKQPRVSERVFGIANNLSHSKNALAEIMTIEPWQIRDLRRTSRTLMSRAEVLTEIAERMVGHLPAGIVKTYNTYDYIKEKRAGFAKLESVIASIVNPQETKVIPLRRP